MPETPTGNIHRDTAFGLTVVAAVALLFHLLGVSGWVQGFLAIAVFTFVPGAAVVAVLPPLSLPARIGLSAAFSMAITAIFAYLLILAHLYYPEIIIWSLYPAACVVLVARSTPTAPVGLRARAETRVLRAFDQLRADPAAVIALAISAIAALIWAGGVFSTNITSLGGLGLVDALPLTWKLGALAALVAAIHYAGRDKHIWWVLALLIGVPVAMFYLTPVIVYNTPHLPWNYKHIGVTDLLLQLHHTRPSLDIYNRWPSFFGAAGVYTRLGGFSDPVHFVKWAEIYFVSIQSALVAAIALAHDRRYGLAGLATILFVAIDWIGQVYFAPQAMGFTLMLAVLLIYWLFLYDGGNRLAEILKSIGSFIVRRKQEWTDERPGEWPRELAAAVVLLPATGLVLVHQLTPYVLLLQLGALWLFGFMKPKWVFFGIAAITILYLLPQLGWVNKNFGLFSSLNPLDNAKNTQTQTFICTGDCAIVQGSARFATLAAWLLAFASILVIGRRRPDARLGALVICFMAPFATLFGQNYGGEASLRVVLFGSPFTALLIALGIFTIKRELLRRMVALVVAVGLGIGLYMAYFGLEGVEYLTPNDLAASNYIAENAPKGSALIASGAQTVSRQSANYGDFYDKETVASLLGVKYQTKQYSRAALRDLITQLSTYNNRIFMAFSPRNTEFNEQTGQFTRGFIQQLRRDMLASGYFEVWKTFGDVEIIEFTPKKKAAAAAKQKKQSRKSN